ncbi:hypothetical protein C7964_103104 [Loktanella sp. PT4BL]|uniref:hypothetical protein n=1 Tax=Loktanella sp. PT4BL TaxID=2135611 RepID=UPI000D76FD10|nr:hypothetical protein [Loktanella sp. PT4BL]PXW68597.1 hypothetical protein C7964_103104 [Loktanella sp. PT4BL]
MTSSDIFEGITAVSQLGSTIVLGLATWVAFVQLSAWKNERRLQIYANKTKCYSDFVSSLASYFDYICANGDMACSQRQRFFEDHNKLAIVGSPEVLERAFLHAKANLEHARAIHKKEDFSKEEMGNLDSESDRTQRELLIAMRNEIYGKSSDNVHAIDAMFREYNQ